MAPSGQGKAPCWSQSTGQEASEVTISGWVTADYCASKQQQTQVELLYRSISTPSPRNLKVLLILIIHKPFHIRDPEEAGPKQDRYPPMTVTNPGTGAEAGSQQDSQAPLGHAKQTILPGSGSGFPETFPYVSKHETRTENH